MPHTFQALARRLAGTALLLGTLALAAGASRAGAQGIPTAERGLGLSVFAAGSLISTDYGGGSYGVTAGGDLTRYYRSFAPSLEVRYTHAITSKETSVAEDSFMGGLKIEKAYQRFHPYGDILIGYGTLRFVQPGDPTYTGDNSVVYGAGGGIEYVLTQRFELKADAQYEHWHLGQAAGSLTPYIYSIGLTYRFPSKKLMAKLNRGKY
jgi:hypothetical protein